MLKLTDLCAVPCHAAKADFVIPPPGSLEQAFIWNPKDRRRFFAIHPKNHELDPALNPHLNPSVAIIGLSPAQNQLDAFAKTYARTKDYGKAARAACFAELANDMIVMLEATGAAAHLGLRFDIRDSFNNHAEVLCDSLVRCASLDESGSSTDWKPGAVEVAEHCVTRRFVAHMLEPRFTRLKTIIILGTKGKAAVETLKVPSGATVRDHLAAAGKSFIYFPHPAGGNREYVALAKQHPLPPCDAWIEAKWRAYRADKVAAGETPDEAKYRKRRRAIWNEINTLRARFGR